MPKAKKVQPFQQAITSYQPASQGGFDCFTLIIPDPHTAERIYKIFETEAGTTKKRVAKMYTLDNFIKTISNRTFPVPVLFINDGRAIPMAVGDHTYNIYAVPNVVPVESFIEQFETKGLSGTLDSLDELLARLEELEKA